jgi:hypothetical protein
MVSVACAGNTPTTPPATRAPDETAALDVLRKAGEAQATYFKINRRYALTFDELVEAHLLSADPSAAQTGYDFKLRPAADAQTYRLLVVPGNSTSGARHFFTDQTGIIRSESGREASADSPELK